MKIRRNHGTVRKQVELAKKKPKHGYPASRNTGASTRWDYNAGFDGAVKLAEEGWSEGAEKIKSVVDKVSEILRPKTFQQEIKYDVTGGYVNVGMYLNGEPECFVNYVPPEKPRKPLRIVVNAAASAAVDAQALINRGAAIAAAIDVLERRGYMVELDIIQSIKNGKTEYTTIARAKDMGQPIDLDRMAFCLAHPAYLRRIIFGVEEQEEKDIQIKIGVGDGYGTPNEDHEIEHDIYFAKTFMGEGRKFATPELAANWVKQVLIQHDLIAEKDFGD